MVVVEVSVVKRKQLAGKLLPPSPPTTPPACASPPTTSSSTNPSSTITAPPSFTLPVQFSALYSLRDDLGSGATGRIFSAIHIPSNSPVAVKVIRKDSVPKSRWILDEQVGLLPIEVFIMRNCSNHRNIIKCYDLHQSDDYLFIVMQLFGTAWKEETLAGPNIDDRLDLKLQQDLLSQHTPLTSKSMDLFELLNRKVLNEDQAHFVFVQLIESLFFLYSKYGILHGDVKDENILVSETGKIKLIDFGGAVFLPRVSHDGGGGGLYSSDDDQDHHVVNSTRQRYPPMLRRDNFFGTLEFSPPELVLPANITNSNCNNTHASSSSSKSNNINNIKALKKQIYDADKAQVWSCGMILYYMIYGCMPHESHQYCRQNVFVSFSLLDLLKGMLEKDPQARMGIEDVLNHNWIKNSRPNGFNPS